MSKIDIIKTGLPICSILNPDILSARISLSLDILPKTRSTPVRKLQGIVNINEYGNIYTINCSTDVTGRSRSTSNSNICLNKFPNTKIRLNAKTQRVVVDRI